VLGVCGTNHCSSRRLPRVLTHRCVRCSPFVDETYEELDKLRTQLDSQKTQTCSEHALPFSYFCNTCSTAVCSDCAIFANSHKGHDFQKIDDVSATRTAASVSINRMFRNPLLT
jgi:hypothetical protein